MALRARNKLSPRKVETIRAAGRYGDGGGLHLVATGDGPAIRRKWVFRFTWNGRQRDMGLGAYPEVSLAAARRRRDDAEADLAGGLDPISAERDRRAKAAGVATFGAVADALIEAKQPEWRNAKHAAQWGMTLREYAKPLRNIPVDQIETSDILKALKPLWQAKPETASRLRGRIEHVLDSARAQGFIPEDRSNPARWRGHLDKLLPKAGKLSRGHHAAMAYRDVPAFLKALRAREGAAALALEFTVLTAARTGEVVAAQWDEIDLQKKVWTVPANRMKAAREHRVPLSDPAIVILERMLEVRASDFVFASKSGEKGLSNMAMTMALRREKAEGATVHGFRSSFRDWVGNETSFSREVAEAALAHVVGDKAEQAYRRSDALEKRRALMSAWANYLGADSNVIPMKRSS